MKARLKKAILAFAGAGLLAAGAMIAINVYMYVYSRQYILADIKKVPDSYTVLVPGARVFSDGRVSHVLHDRLETALELYKTGKVKKFLLSGDHGSRYYDEVNKMKKFILRQEVPHERIFLDHAGFDTYDSMVRAKKIFLVKDVVVVTQAYHLPRAIFIARKIGLRAYGLKADRRTYVKITYFRFREFFASVRAFFDVAFSRRPKFLGVLIPITGDGRLSWYGKPKTAPVLH